MNRALILLVLPAIVVGNLAGAWFWRQRLATQVEASRKALEDSPQAQLTAQRAQLEGLQNVVGNWQFRSSFDLSRAQSLFEQAAVGWAEISLGSSEEEERKIRLDILTVRGLGGSEDQLTRVDRRLAPRCQQYRRTPTRDGTFILSCQLKP